MKVILKVAGTELRTLFFSPIAWFLMIVFLIQSGLAYFGQIEAVARQVDISGSKQEFFTSITDWVYLGYSGMFKNVMEKLYLYIPLLTMSLISREISSGTIKLLYSSPVRMYEIVFGKYLAMMAYSLLLVLIVGVFMISGIINVPHIESGVLLSAMLGFYLLLCAYAAIGLFMSCLTGYQVVAAVSAFVMIGALSYMGTVWQRIGFVRELTYYLSIAGRTQKMLSGLITSNELIYFFVIIYIFLGLSILKLKAGMESRSAAVKAVRYLAVVASALFVGYVSSIPGFIGYKDTTSTQSRTLTPRVQQIVQALGDEPLEITAYVNLLDRYFYLGSPDAYNSNKARWEAYLRFKHNIELKHVMYYDSAKTSAAFAPQENKSLKELADIYAKTYNVDLQEVLTPAQIRERIDLRDESNRYVMQLKWKGRTTFLRVFDDMWVWPSETEVAAALQRLQQASLPRIAFVNSELERDYNRSGDRDYKTLTNLPSFRFSLINQGLDVMGISLEKDRIPDSISALVLADPGIAFSPVAMEKLQQYIADGGNLLIAGEPGKQPILNPLLQSLGVQLGQGLMLQESRNNAPDFVSAYVEKEAGAFYKSLQYAIEDSLALTMPGVVGVSYERDGPFTIQPLVRTDGRTSWLRMLPYNKEIAIRARVTRSSQDSLGTVHLSPTDGDLIGPHTTVIGLHRTVNGKDQRIVVSGDADFLSNKELSRGQRSANFAFSTALFRWISGGEFPVDTSRPEAKDKKMNYTSPQLKLQRIIFLWVLPGILLAFAVFLLIRRKRK